MSEPSPDKMQRMIVAGKSAPAGLSEGQQEVWDRIAAEVAEIRADHPNAVFGPAASDVQERR